MTTLGNNEKCDNLSILNIIHDAFKKILTSLWLYLQFSILNHALEFGYFVKIMYERPTRKIKNKIASEKVIVKIIISLLHYNLSGVLKQDHTCIFSAI